jgi:predicted RNA-binding protein YlqC (UPF0109 family)
MIESENNPKLDTSLMMFKQLLEHIIRAIVNRPEGVKIQAEPESNGKQSLIIIVDEHDLGKIIGKNGQTIKAIRALINALNPGPHDIMVTISK